MSKSARFLNVSGNTRLHRTLLFQGVKMDQARIEELTDLLGESLKSIEVLSEHTAPLAIAEYRTLLQGVGQKYDPGQRAYISTWSLDIGQSNIEQQVLDFIKSELGFYLVDDKLHSAAFIVNGGMASSTSVNDILRSLLRKAIVDGEATAAQAFADRTTGTSCSYSEYYALAGLQVDSEAEVLEGIWLIPLSSSPDHLPPYLPDDLMSVFVRRPGEFVAGRPWARTLLRIDHTVSPILYKPPETHYAGSDLESAFKDTWNNRKAHNLGIDWLFHALSLAGKCNVLPVARWRGFPEPYEMLDQGTPIGPKRVTWYPQEGYHPTSPQMVETYGAEVKRLYESIVRLRQNTRKRLQIPISRCLTSLGQRDDTDRMIDLGIAFESLYLGDGEYHGEVTFRFALRSSWYLGQDKADRKRLFGIFKEIYNARSKAVHTGSFMRNEDPDERMEFIEQAQSLCLRSIETVIARGTFPDWNDLTLGD